MSFKAAHPEWMPADPSGSLYLSRIADLSARRASDDQTPRPNVSLSPTTTATDRTREYERALHESQTAAVRRRGAAALGVGGVGFDTASTMLGQSTGTVYQSGMAQSVSLGDSDGSVAVANLQPPAPPSYSSSSSAAVGVPMPSGVSGSASGELGADSQGDVRSTLGESYVDGARRHPRGGLGGRSIQEEDDEDGLGADGGVLGLLAQIYSGTSGGGARGVLS